MERVARCLHDQGRPVLTFFSDAVLSGAQELSVAVRPGSAVFELDGHRFHPQEVSAAWWRKPQWLELPRTDRARRLSLTLELDHLHRELATLIPASAWLNSPAAMRAAELRLVQLQAAAAAGFEVPATVITTQWRAARQGLGQDLVFKSFRGSLVTGADERIVFTNRLRDAELDRLAATTRPYPGFFQPFIAKRAEWRVYVIGAETLSVRIQTADHAPGVDWRREQLDDSVRFCVGELPLDERRMCQEVVDRLGLRFAALDLIEREDGTFTFLEANPNGQYMWLEESLDLPVSPAIARALLAERGGWRSGG